MTLPQHIIQQLTHADANQRSLAIRELDTVSNALKLDILLERLCNESDLFVREDLTYALTKMGRDAIPALLPLLYNEDANIRHDVAHVLGKIGDASAVDALIPRLQDSSDRVIIKTTVALGQIRDAQAIPALTQLFEHDNLEVRTNCLTVLEEFGKDVIPHLLPLLKHEKWQIREQALDALGLTGDKSLIPALSNLLDDESPQVRFSAKTALHYCGAD